MSAECQVVAFLQAYLEGLNGFRDRLRVRQEAGDEHLPHESRLLKDRQGCP